MSVYRDMENGRELQIAREHIKELEIENVKLITERDTLRNVINVGGLNKPAIDPALAALSRPTKETHPKIQFWTQAHFNDWLLTPEAQVAKRGKEPYLEEENSEPISDDRLKSIRETLRSGWCELVFRKRAPRVWGQLDADSKEFFHLYIEKSWPLFKFAENGWKLDRIACTSYPAWRSNHLNDNGKFLSKGEKRKRRDMVKVEDENVPPPSKSIKVSTDTSASASNSTPVTEDVFASPNVEKLPTSVFATPAAAADPAVAASAPAIAPFSAAPPPPVVASPTIAAIPGPTTVASLAIAAAVVTSPAIPAVPTTVAPPAVVATPLAASTTNSIASALAGVQHKDALQDLASVAAGLGITIPEKPSTSESKGSSDPRPTAGGSIGGKKIPKINLCAHRWLKAFKETTNGTTPEFREYYDSLSKEQREAYDKEAADLVAKNKWNKDSDVLSGPIH